MRSFSLQPIQAGVRTQIEVSREIMAVVRELGDIAASLPEEQKAKVVAVTEKLLKTSDRITGAATETVKFIRKVAA